MAENQKQAEREDIEGLVKWWANALGLNHWRIQLEIDPGDLDTFSGRTWNASDYHHSTVQIRTTRQGFTWGERDLEETVVHELLHVLGRDLLHTTDTIIGMVPKPMRKKAGKLVEHSNEQMIEALAHTLVALRYMSPDADNDAIKIGGVLLMEGSQA